MELLIALALLPSIVLGWIIWKNDKVEKEPTKKTQKERVKKENPTKEMIIQEIAKILPNFATDVNIENAGKIITFTVGNDNFKLDLTQKRKPKAEK